MQFNDAESVQLANEALTSGARSPTVERQLTNALEAIKRKDRQISDLKDEVTRQQVRINQLMHAVGGVQARRETHKV